MGYLLFFLISFFHKGEKAFFQKKFREAKFYLERSIKEEPASYKAYSYLGDIYLLEEEYEKAEKYYKKAIVYSPNPAKEYFRLGQVYIKKGEYKKAEDAFKKAYSLDPSLKPSLFMIGYIALFFERNKEKVISYWERFIQEAPQDPQREKIEKVLALLRDKDFILPPPGSDVPLEEVLRLGKYIKPEDIKPKVQGEKEEKEKEKNQKFDLIEEDSL